MDRKAFLFSGPDRQIKDEKIHQIKSRWLKNPDAASFDFNTFYSSKLDLEQFQQTLAALPVVAERRVVVLHDCDRLSVAGQDFLKNYLEGSYPHIILILDTDDSDLDKAFFKAIAARVELARFGYAATRSVFDVTRAMSQNQPAEALKILKELMDAGEHPLRLMPGILWFWTSPQARISPDKKEKGLRLIQEADLNIKRSRMSAEQSMEVLVVKLSSLMR